MMAAKRFQAGCHGFAAFSRVAFLTLMMTRAITPLSIHFAFALLDLPARR